MTNRKAGVKVGALWVLTTIILLSIPFSTPAKKPHENKPQEQAATPQPTRESLEARIHELIDAAVRKDEKKIASMVLGGKGERHSWNRQVIWEYMKGLYSKDCGNIIIYINGYTAYTRFWCLPEMPEGPCPERKGGARYWVFRGQWYLAKPPYRNEDPPFQKEWLDFIEEHQDATCLSENDAKVVEASKELMVYLMDGNLTRAVTMISRWSGRNSFDRSFNLDDTRIDTICSFYKVDFLGLMTPVSYRIDSKVEHTELSFSPHEPGKACYYIVKVVLIGKSGENSEITLVWLKEGNEFKLWEKWYQ